MITVIMIHLDTLLHMNFLRSREIGIEAADIGIRVGRLEDVVPVGIEGWGDQWHGWV